MAEQLAKVGDVIPQRAAIPSNVNRVADEDGAPWELQPTGLWFCVRPEEGTTPIETAILSKAWGPLTVTAVREPEPTAVPQPEQLAHHATDPERPNQCVLHGLTAAQHGPQQRGVCLPAEPQPESDLLDFVRRYGKENYECGAAEPSSHSMEADRHDDKARALLARIEAEVQRLRDQEARLETKVMVVQADRDDHAALLKATDATLAKVTAERDEALAARDDVLAESDKRLNALIKTRSEREDLRRERDEARKQVLKERDENAEWADRLAQAIAEFLHIDIGEHSNMNLPWQAALIALTDAVSPAQPDPHTLTLPQVPERAVALVGNGTHERYTPGAIGWENCDGDGYSFAEILEREGDKGVRVEMAPPCEPREFLKYVGMPDLKGFIGKSGTRYVRSALTSSYAAYVAVHNVGAERELLLSATRSHWQEIDGPLTEVFDEPGGAS